MESLASLFITLVTFANTLAPQANIAQILDVTSDNQNEVLSLETSSNSADPRTKVAPRDLTRKNLEEVREKRRLELEKLIEKRRTLLNSRKTEREAFKEKVSELRDSKKAEIVTRIDENISKLNDKWVEQLNKVLDRLSELLAKIKSRTQTASESGKDVEMVNEEISQAESAIKTAQDAVNTQSTKTYVVTITSEAGIGRDVKTTINSFHNDIKNTKELVDNAKKATTEALRALKTVLGETENEAR